VSSNEARLPDSTHPTDREFDRLFVAYFDRLRRYVYRYVRSWEEAEDLVLDLFAAIWTRSSGLTGIADLEGYLYTAARNRSLERLRRHGLEGRWRERQSTALAGAPSPPTPEQELDARELGAAIQRALDALSPRQRDVILLQWRGASHQEIAATLGMALKTVSVHVNRALEAFREALGPDR